MGELSLIENENGYITACWWNVQYCSRFSTDSDITAKVKLERSSIATPLKLRCLISPCRTPHAERLTAFGQGDRDTPRAMIGRLNDTATVEYSGLSERIYNRWYFATGTKILVS